MTRYIFGGSPADYVVALDGSNDGLVRYRPLTELTMWNTVDGGSQVTDLITVDGNTAVSFLTTDAKGRLPRFYGPDDNTKKLFVETGDGSRYPLVSSDVPDVLDTKLGRTEAPAAHTHSSDEVPALARAIASTPRIVLFDTVNNRWPNQADITATYPAVPVLWIGNATIPSQARKGFDYIDQLVVDGSTHIPDPTPVPDPNPVTPDPAGIILTAPTVVVNGALVNVHATLTSTDSVTLAYAQIAVRGPSGQGRDTAFNTAVTVDGTLDLNGSFTADETGTTWRAYATYNRTGGTDQSNWVDGAATTFGVTLPTNGGGGGNPTQIANVHSTRSGVPWNSGAFVDGNLGSQWNQSSQAAFGTYRGRLSDVMLVFNDAASDWTSHNTLQSSWASWPGILVWTIPFQPKFLGDNRTTANGSNDAQWHAVCDAIIAAGRNNNKMVLRLDHEWNGDWYPWSAGKTGGSDAFIGAWNRVGPIVRSRCPNVLLNTCMNKDWTGQGGRDVFDVLNAIKPNIDIVGFDGYDLYDGMRNDSGRKTAWYNKSGPQRNNVASWCRSNGKMMSLDEWGLISTSGADGTGGGDDVLYITDTYDWCNTNKDILAYESYFMAPGNTGYNHELNNGQYPNAQAAYRSSSRWGNL